MLNKDEELGCVEILKTNFPNLNGQSLVMGLYEFLDEKNNFNDFICKTLTAKEAVVPYIQQNLPYIVLDESEGYKCLFLKGQHIKVQFDVTHNVMMRYFEET